MGRDLNTRGLCECGDAPNFLMPAGIFDVWHQHIIASGFDDAAISAKAREGLGPRQAHTAIIRHAAQPRDGRMIGFGYRAFQPEQVEGRDIADQRRRATR